MIRVLFNFIWSVEQTWLWPIPGTRNSLWRRRRQFLIRPQAAGHHVGLTTEFTFGKNETYMRICEPPSLVLSLKYTRLHS